MIFKGLLPRIRTLAPQPGTVAIRVLAIPVGNIAGHSMTASRLRHGGRSAQAFRDLLDGQGANAILAPRCFILSGNFEDFWAERAESPLIQAEIQT